MDFFVTEGQNGLPLAHSYSAWLVALSFIVATGGSTLALYVAGTVARTPSTRSREILMIAGAAAFGLAVWSMHFIGMLAFSLCTSVSYDIGITFLSALPAIAAAWVVLHWLALAHLTFSRLLLGGVITGAGIGLMHYSGMEAMRMTASLRFDPTDFIISIVAAVALATFALWARSGLRQQMRISRTHANGLSALSMGAAITAMHYIGMRAARFHGPAETEMPIPPSDWGFLAILISMGILSVLGLVASGVLMTRLKTSLEEIKLQSLELEAIIQNSTEAIVITDANGAIKQVNMAFENIFGNSNANTAGNSLSAFLPEWHAMHESNLPQTPQEAMGRREDGSDFPIRVSFTRLISDSLAFYVGFISDLSDVKRVEAQLRNDANHDFLTGLHNRRYLDEQLMMEFERSRRSELPLSVMLLDIDHFKRVNDDYGHPAGDQVLKLLASTLRKRSRAGDISARYGGEEFILLMPGTPLDDARQMAERLRQDAQKLELRHDGKRIKFTISLGLSCLTNQLHTSPESLLEEADKALYAAKHAGRNRAEVFNPAMNDAVRAK